MSIVPESADRGRAAVWLVPDRLFDGDRLRDGLAVRVEGRMVREVAPRAFIPEAADRRTVPGTLFAGFFDLQVNGGGGVLLNADPTPRGIRAIVAAHRALGTTRLLPTLISDRPEVMEAATGAILTARDDPGVAGIHFEGPHIAVAKRGTHDARVLRPLDAHSIGLMRQLREAGVAVMMTLAPEAVRPGQIAELAGMGVVVAIGHSDADADSARAAFAEGARMVTHLFNAMSQMQGRAPGVTGAAINAPGICASVIADGIHVADEMLAMAIRARPEPGRMIAVSDAMPTVGGPDGFTLYGREIRLAEGRLVNAEGALAGAHLWLARAAERLAGPLGLGLEEALRMSVSIPAALMGQGEAVRIQPGYSGPLVSLWDDFTARIVEPEAPAC